MGAAGMPEPEEACAGYAWTRTSFGSTGAQFTGSQGYVSMVVVVDYDCTHSGDVDLWVEAITTDGTDLTPSAPLTISGPEVGGSVSFYDLSGNGTVTAVELGWDVAGAFSTVCVSVVDAQ